MRAGCSYSRSKCLEGNKITNSMTSSICHLSTRSNVLKLILTHYKLKAMKISIEEILRLTLSKRKSKLNISLPPGRFVNQTHASHPHSKLATSLSLL